MSKAVIPNVTSTSFKAEENINTKLQRRDFISKQASIMTQWICDTPLFASTAGITSGVNKVILNHKDGEYDDFLTDEQLQEK